MSVIHPLTIDTLTPKQFPTNRDNKRAGFKRGKDRTQDGGFCHLTQIISNKSAVKKNPTQCNLIFLVKKKEEEIIINDEAKLKN